MSELAQLLVAAVRWDDKRGVDRARDGLERALSLGVGGLLLAGVPAESVRTLVADARRRSATRLLIAADLERGAGGAFPGASTGATTLPPAAALGALDDQGMTRLAARVTAREALALGVDWALAPVADLDISPGSVALGSRTFGGDTRLVARHVALWIETCQREGALACVKHFPGHGRAPSDSQHELDVVDATADELWEVDLAPFRAAVQAGVASLMTAHVAFRALDHTGAPATLSRPIVTGLLRERLGFDGLVVSDALDMGGILAAGSEPVVAVRALAAGCDVLLSPREPAAVVSAIEGAVRSRELSVRTLDRALERRAELADRAQRSAGVADVTGSTAEDLEAARGLAWHVVREARGGVPPLGARVVAVVVDDAVRRAPGDPPNAAFRAALGAAGFDVRWLPSVDALDPRTNVGARAPVLLFVLGAPPGASGAGLTQGTRDTVARAVVLARDAMRSLVVVLCAPPRLATQLPDAPVVVTAWDPAAPMPEGAARWLADRR